MKQIITYILLAIFPCLVAAQDSINIATPAEIGAQTVNVSLGDSAYAKGDYSTAIAIYENVLNSGNESADLYYNLGNAYYKSEEIAKAILNYERALLLSPSDKNIIFNLELAKSKTVDKLSQGFKIFFVEWIKSLINLMGMNAWCIIGIVAFVVMLVSILLFLFNSRISIRKIGFATAIVTLFVTIFANIAAYTHYERLTNRNTAIVIEPSITAKSTPDKSGTSLFVIHEGHKVKIIDDSMHNWKEIELEDGTVGWLPVTAIERI